MKHKRQTAVLALNFVAMTQHGMILLLLGPLVPSIMETFGVGEGTAGALLSAGSLGFMLGPLLAGVFIDKHGTRSAFVIGSLIEVGFLVILGISPVFVVAVFANLLMHFGAAFIETGANVLPTQIRTNRSAHSIMNLVHVFFSVGAFIGPFLIGIYVDQTGLWRPVFLFMLVPTAILLGQTLFTRLPHAAAPEPAADSAPTDRSHAPGPALIIKTLKNRKSLFGAAALLFYVGTEVGISSWVVHYLEQVQKLPKVQAASGLSILWIFIMIGRYVNSVLGNRLSSRFLVVVSSITGFAGVILFVLTRGAAAAYGLLALIGLCLSGVFPNIMGELNNRFPNRIGTVTAVMMMGAACGAMLFQWFVGFVAEHVSLQAAFIVPGVLQLLVIVSFLIAIAPDSTKTMIVDDDSESRSTSGPGQ